MTAFADKLNRTQPLTPSDRKALVDAAATFEQEAAMLLRDHSFDGKEFAKHDEQAKDAKKAHRRFTRHASELRRIAGLGIKRKGSK